MFAVPIIRIGNSIGKRKKKEPEKMVETCVDAVLELLPTWAYLGEWPDFLKCQEGLRCIKMMLWCFVSCDCDADLRFIYASLESIIDGRTSLATSGDWKTMVENIGRSRSIIKKHSERLMWKSLKCKPLASHEIQQFLQIILINVDYLSSSYEDNQNDLKEKLEIFMNLVQFITVECVNCKAVEDFKIHVLSWATKAAFLLFSVHESENKADWWLTDLLHKANPCTPEFIEMCFAVITLTKFSRSDILLFVEFVSCFIDLLLKDLMFISKDDFEKVREGLIYLFVYLAGPPATSAENSELFLIQNQIDAVLSKASLLICLFGEVKVDPASVQDVLLELMNMIDQVRGKFDTHHLHQIPHSSWSNFPRTSGLGFVESLLIYLQDLEEEMNTNPKFVRSLKQQIMTIKEELASLRPFLQDISHLLNEHKDLKDLWEEIICLAHQAELTIKQSFFTYHPFCLSYILTKIQDIKPKIMRVKGNDIYRTASDSSFMSSSKVIETSVPSLGVDQEVVGFMEEIPILVDRLTRGTTTLDVVSVVGMGGIGKTTLAIKIFTEKPVVYHFHVRAFCTVSQAYSQKSMLRDILSSITMNKDELSNITEEDLAHRLYKRLKGRRYLIVLDDIWNISAWDDVKSSFPDDGIGSRIVFTTRIIEIPSLAKMNCSPHMIRFLTLEESWDLLQRKVFQKDPCPPDLSEVGRLIAKNCKGLPLAVVLVGGLLAKTERSMSWWQEVASHLTSFVSYEGCKDVLELSYKHLSETLKSCLLYLAAFPEDTKFRAGFVARLWAAEGFIQTPDKSYMHKNAKEHLNYLGDRSMIIVQKRSLAGKIKSFRLHDVIRDFCITKAKEEQFLSIVNGHNINSSVPLKYDGHRICILAEWRSFLNGNPRGPTVQSLQCFDDKGHGWMDAYSLNSLFRNFKLLQVLHLPFFVRILGFPTELRTLIHLRYLKVTFYHESESGVLRWMANLSNLESLIITGGYWGLDLGDTIWKMRRLRHLDVPDNCLVALDDDATSQLPDLETFGHVKILEGKNGEELLRRLPNLRKLSCWCYPSTKLDILTRLESLYIENSEGSNYPSAFSFPSTLRKLTLAFFQLSSTELSTMIGKRPCLRILKLKWCRFDGNRWDVDDDEFPHLKFLELYGSEEIEYWSATTDSFCSLEKLVLSYCPQLVEIPACFGEVVTLRALKVTQCSEEVEKSAIQIQKDQLDMGNDSLEFVTYRAYWHRNHRPEG